MARIDPENIGYYGRPITALTREELLNAFVEIISLIQDCADRDGKCKDALRIIDDSKKV